MSRSTRLDEVTRAHRADQARTCSARLALGHFLLGLVIERVSGKDYETFLRERFFDPLEMRDTGTTLPSELSSRAAKGYRKTKSGKMDSVSDDPAFGDPDCTLVFGSGQIYSTTLDLARWDRALASGRVAGSDRLFEPNLNGFGYGWVLAKRDGVDYVWHNGALSPLGFSSYLVRVPSKDRMIAYLANLEHDIIEPLEEKVATLAVETD